MAVMLGALLIHRVSPGSSILELDPHVFWALIARFWIGNLLLLIPTIPLIGLSVRLLLIPYHLLFPAILRLNCIGVYSLSFSAFDIGLVLLFGVVGYFIRRAMLIGRADPPAFVDRQVSFWLLVVAAAPFIWTAVYFVRTAVKADPAAFISPQEIPNHERRGVRAAERLDGRFTHLVRFRRADVWHGIRDKGRAIG